MCTNEKNNDIGLVDRALQLPRQRDIQGAVEVSLIRYGAKKVILLKDVGMVKWVCGLVDPSLHSVFVFNSTARSCLVCWAVETEGYKFN